MTGLFAKLVSAAEQASAAPEPPRDGPPEPAPAAGPVPRPCHAAYEALGLSPRERERFEEDSFDLFPTQVEALHECRRAGTGGSLGMGVGAGKTYVSLLVGAALGCDLTLLFVPPRCYEQVLADREKLSKYFDLRPVEVHKYSTLSSNKWLVEEQRLLERVGDQKVCVVFDEAHYIRNGSAARTKRARALLGDLAKRREDHKIVVMSGTLLNGTPYQYWHLVAPALQEHCWLPLDRRELWAWERILRRVKDEEPIGDWMLMSPTKTLRDQLISDRRSGDAEDSDEIPFFWEAEDVLKAYHKLVQRAPGSILDGGKSVGASLYIEQAGLPKLKGEALTLYRRAMVGEHPAGHQLTSPSDVAATLKCLSLGFYYQWKWPNDEPDWVWLERRNDWARLCRHELESKAQRGYDTPMLVAQALETGRREDPELLEAWLRWREVRHRASPDVQAVWVDDSIMEAVATLAEKHPMIVWYRFKAVAQWLARRGLPVRFAGEDVVDDGSRSVALSLSSHGTGLNLQQYSCQLFTYAPSKATLWEQAVGRSHRTGQEADEVVIYVPRHTRVLRDALTTAVKEARYVTLVSGVSQRLVRATHLYK